MDKENQSQLSKRDLPNTPRVCGKILEYYQKFGQERDLEKFMRLYSPASSQGSEKNQGDDCSSKTSSCKRTKSAEPISTNNIFETALIPPRPLSVCCETNSKSLPNIDIQGQAFGKDFYAAAVNINIEADGGKENILSISTENLKTPQKTFRSTKTQTPESVAKTHRRLEWDSLGDVGYKKSMSASNISNTERSLLKEFFKEKSAVSEPSPAASNEEGNFKDKQFKNREKLKVSEKEHSTPPLACSTLVNLTENGAKPKTQSQSTSSTSLAEKFEKYAQTSIIKSPSVRSQEIQCTLSSSYSVAEGTATPSSFEYYSSSKSKSSDVILNTNDRNRLKLQEHPFITSITDLLTKRETLDEKNQQKRHLLFSNISDLQTKFDLALDENKENQTHGKIDPASATSFSLRKQAPELDLGIQLICSLIEAKSINGKQKKQLIRDIIKRLTHIENEEKTENSTSTNCSEGKTSNSSNLHHQNIYDSVRPESSHNEERNVIKSLVLGVSPLKTKMKAKESTTSSTNTSDGCNDILAAKQPKNQTVSRAQKIHEFCISRQQDKVSCKQFPATTNHTQKNIRVSSAAAKKINKETQSELIRMEQNTYEGKQTANYCKSTAETSAKKCFKSNRYTQTSKTSLTSTSTMSTAPDLTKEKLKTNASPEMSNSNTDAEQPTMREWLNPLTQSEIEYEEKKQTEIRKKAAAQQEKLMRKAKHDCGRVQQLNWIENEIKRLECLKHLLLKGETATKISTSIDTSQHKNSTKNSSQTDKLYDTVYTDKSTVLSESAEQLVHEIEIILEESQEDIINFKSNSKHSKERKKETQIIYEKENNCLKNCNTNPNLHIINENTNIQGDKLFQYKQSEMNNKLKKQREKIDTPSTDISKGSETLKDMVLQRKREFMEAYKSKKQRHFDALKQQQDFKYLNMPQKLSGKSTTTTDSEHYSVPHTIPTKYTSNDASYYAQHPTPVVPIEKKGTKNKHTGQQQSSKPLIKETIIPKSATVNNSATNSSSSMFCMSSEISVPMGSQNFSSSSSSAHAYNGVSVQTSDSIRLSKPFYGPTTFQRTQIPHNPTVLSSTACIQVKPKGIAYVIEFDDKQAVSNSASDANQNSDVLKNSKKNSIHSPTSNLKSSSTSEQLLTLQEHLEKSKPKFLKHSKERKAILNQLQSMRQERSRQLREIIENTSLNSLDRRLRYLPPPPIQKVRILRTKEMKALTNKRFAKLPEVLAKQELEIEEKQRRINRILRDVFNKRLQKRVRSGKLSLNHSKTVV